MMDHDRCDHLHTICPYCGVQGTHVHQETNGYPTPPEPGDISICNTCAGIAIFTEIGLRLPTESEHLELIHDVNVQEVVRRNSI